MKKWLMLVGLSVGSLLLAGCLEIEQEVFMNHDGSGKIVEKVALSPRGVRLVEGLGKRTGKPVSPVLFSEESYQTRLKALGEVTLAGKEEVALPDGRKQVKSTYTFKDINKVRFWTAPSLSHKKLERGKFDGSVVLKFNPKYDSWGRTYRETVTVEGPGWQGVPPQPMVSPAERQKYVRVLPIFLSMLDEFNLSITMIAPIEEFEENDMRWNLPIDKNRVTIFRGTGAAFAQGSDMVRQLIMNEVMGVGNYDGMPGVFTSWPGIHGGRGVRFMKSTPIGK